MKLRMVTREGIRFNETLFRSRELEKLLGIVVCVDDLGVEDTDEILVRDLDGKVICTAGRDGRGPFQPMKKGKFERELQRRGIKKTADA